MDLDWTGSYQLNPFHTLDWGISARAHVQRYPHTALLYLGNGLADCVQIWYVGWGSLTKCLPQVMDGVHLHVRTCAPLFRNCSACCFSVTVGPIALKFCTWESISYRLCSSHGWGISARAHVHTALLYLTNDSADCVQIWCVGFESLPKCFPQVMGWVFLHVRTCRLRFCISGTAWPIEFNFGGELGVMNYMLNAIRGLGISARAHVHTPLLYIRNGMTDCVQIWYVDWRSLSTCFPQVMGGASLHVGISARAHVHPHLSISGSEWPIVLKFDLWLETQ